MNSGNRISRRDALRHSLAAGTAASIPWVVPSTVLGTSPRPAPSGRITLGVIGLGPRGKFDLGWMLKQPDCQCVAVCDVQARRRDAGKQLVDAHYGKKDCKVYRDFRELLSRRDIDAVLIATGDRWHAPASIHALRAGKDVYSEKPCGMTIELCQKLDDVVRQTGRVFQAGTQRRSVANFQAAVRLARSGKLGKLQTLFASVYKPSIDTLWLAGQPTPPREVCDWDLWLGPAPWRPYNRKYVEGDWRNYWDFDSGARLLDWGAHTVDLCQWANKADDTCPIEFEPAGKSIQARYANGVHLVLDELDNPFNRQRPGWIELMGTCPVRFVGDHGWVETGDSGEIAAHPASLLEEVKAENRRRSGLDIDAHARNFFDCVKSRQRPAANSSVMRRSHLACHAAALSWILGRKLRFDPVKEEFVGDEEANGLRSRAARAPWAV